MVLWQGLSRLDRATPVVVLATYNSAQGNNSTNSKTGDMVQTWILHDKIEPHVTVSEGLDMGICGSCPLRSPASGGSGACYVTVFRAPLSVWRAYKRGNIRPFDATVFRGRKVRFGAYGDPAAAPFEIWQAIAEEAAAVTGYTHAWRDCDKRFSSYCMASADSVHDYLEARRLGYRSFLVRPVGTPKPIGLVVCPASAEAGNRTSCSECLQCGGNSIGRHADITIEAHGWRAKKFPSNFV